MEVKEQTKKLKEMINGYKLTYLIMSANNIGLLNILDDKGKTLRKNIDTDSYGIKFRRRQN